MTRAQWIALAAIGAPVIVGAFLVTAAFGPLGAIGYGAILALGANSPRLFHHHDHEGHR